MDEGLYLNLEIKQVALGRATEAIHRLSYINGLMQSAPSFVDALYCRYLGNPTRYLLIRSWQSKEAYAAFRATPASQDFNRMRPLGILYETPLAQEWNQVREAVGTSTKDFLIRRVFRVGEGLWKEFADARKRYDQEAVKSCGSVGTYRLVSSRQQADGDAMVLERWAGRRSYDEFLEGADFADYIGAAGEDLYSTVVTECYEVVAEVKALVPPWAAYVHTRV